MHPWRAFTALLAVALSLSAAACGGTPEGGAAAQRAASGASASPQDLAASGAPSVVPSAAPSKPAATKPAATKPPPKPPTGGKPGPSNTGVPAGVSLKVVRGDQTYSTANQVISGLDVHGFAAYQVTQDGGRANSNLRVEYNWIDGGGCSLNLSHKGGPTPMTGIYVIGNRFGRGSQFDCPILLSTKTVLSQNSGNVWDDTGRPIPKPQQHD